MTTQEFDRFLMLEDYLKRYVAKELQSFRHQPPTNAMESELQKIFKLFLEYFDLENKYSQGVEQKINDVQYWSDKERERVKILQNLCRSYGINPSTAFYQTTDF